MSSDTRETSDIRQHDFLIIGAGMAAHAAAVGIRAQGATGSIAILGAEADGPVERPALSKDLWSGDDAEGTSALKDTAGETGASLVLGDAAASIDVEARTVTTESGAVHGYGELLVATGGVPRTLDGLDEGERVIAYRSLDDYRRLRALATATPAPRIAVVGAGFVGTEIAASLSRTDADVVLVHPGARVADHVLPDELATELERELTEHDVDLHGGAEVSRGEVRLDGVTLHLDDDTSVDADVVVIGLGVRPATRFVEGVLDLADDGGIVVDEHLRTSAPHVWAAGDVAQYPDPILGLTRVEHVDAATTQGEAAGRAMAGGTEPYAHTPIFWSDVRDLGYEAVGTLSTRLQTVVDPVGDGTVVYYLDDDAVRGVLLWNVWEQTDAAKEVLAGPRPADPAELRGRIG
ncbi:FAD-dependent oxidoreductase [Nocardioides sp. TRM66260-LWL]|uniref:NAD(P)/FAD-dependent oxidoreductase n=1 Tax=Nocardioides sp. TRM66260-LWL TaxID=2874478 RepID=UPI001CC3F281|nr:FAD-dependent oxidoreductase [Nocardioides sp. TRM66260-LWL]MBZ5733957.1 FAD-dependent oxidoreductase [Nocardioides sp. TRM66260-LWL]